jgi:hypothetical protein
MEQLLVFTQRLATALLASAVLITALPAQNPERAGGTPVRDARIGLRAGWWDAAQAAWNMRLVSTTKPPTEFIPAQPGNFDYMNSDLAFRGTTIIQGNFQGFSIWDAADPFHPKLIHAETCPEQQNDVSVYKNLLFLSGESQNGRLDCGKQGNQGPVSPERFRGVRVIDISDLTHPRVVANVQTCRGSHTHTLVTDPKDTSTVYIYVSGQAPVRPAEELAGCSSALPEQDTASARFRIDIIRVPLAHPEQAAIVSRPRLFEALVAPPSHGAAPTDSAAAQHVADSAAATGAYVVKFQGLPIVLPPQFVQPMLDSVARAGGRTAPNHADSVALRGSIQKIIDDEFLAPMGPNGVRHGPDQCHDITVYPQMGLAGGACAGYGLLLDITDPAHPVRLAAASDSNFSYWHSATFNNDASKVIFTDEWGGGVAARCRATDKPEWGADAIFSVEAKRALQFQGYYKLPVQQTTTENCVAHNGNLIPVPGRDIMVQGWYQGGVSVFDFTDPARPVEIAYFDRGPMDSTKLEIAGSWSAYWYNGYIYSTEIMRGLDVLELQPSAQLTQNEIDAAKLVKLGYQNVQDQQRLTWPASFVVARVYLDQLERSKGLPAARLAAVRRALTDAERAKGTARRSALNTLATQLNREATSSSDSRKVLDVASVVRDLAR